MNKKLVHSQQEAVFYTSGLSLYRAQSSFGSSRLLSQPRNLQLLLCLSSDFTRPPRRLFLISSFYL